MGIIRTIRTKEDLTLGDIFCEGTHYTVPGFSQYPGLPARLRACDPTPLPSPLSVGIKGGLVAPPALSRARAFP